jgi:hypothetical protein
MAGFVEGVDRGQSTLFPAVLDEYIGDDNPVRAIDVFVDGLDLAALGFDGVQPLALGRPAYHPATMRSGSRRLPAHLVLRRAASTGISGIARICSMRCLRHGKSLARIL